MFYRPDIKKREHFAIFIGSNLLLRRFWKK